MKKLLVGAVCGLAFAVTAFAENAAGIGSARLKGYLGGRLDAMIERHVAGADVDYITAPFLEKTERKGWWQTEFWGKWMHSAVPYAAYADSEKLRAKIDRGIERMLASQEPCGYIGNYPDELRCGEGWDVWGMKYTLMGLLHYYDMGGPSSCSAADARERVPPERACAALEACKRLCDYVIAAIGQTAALTPHHFNRLLREAGGYAPVEEGLEVDMNGDFLSVHRLRPGRYDLRLPRACRVVNLKSRLVEPSDGLHLRLQLTAGESCRFRLED